MVRVCPYQIVIHANFQQRKNPRRKRSRRVLMHSCCGVPAGRRRRPERARNEERMVLWPLWRLSLLPATYKLRPRGHIPQIALYIPSASVTSWRCWQMPKDLSSRNTHNRSLQPHTCKIRPVTLRTTERFHDLTHTFAALDQRISFVYRIPTSFCTWLLICLGIQKLHQRRRSWRAFREKLIYQVVCCIPGVFSGAHRLSFSNNIQG